MGIPPRDTASTANRASSAEDTRIAGMIPISSIRLRTSCLFNDPAPQKDLPMPAGGWLSLNCLLTHCLIQLSCCRQVRADQADVSQLHGAVLTLCVQKIQQGRP